MGSIDLVNERLDFSKNMVFHEKDMIKELQNNITEKEKTLSEADYQYRKNNLNTNRHVS